MNLSKDPNGELFERVRLFVGDEAKKDVAIFEDYHVKVAILQQPAAFATRLSAARGAPDILRKFLPGTKYTLSIANQPQFVGTIDAADAESSSNGTFVTLRGRDLLAKLFDSDVDAAMTFTNVTFRDITKKALAAVGLGDLAIHLDNKQNREIKSGVKVVAVKEPVVRSDVIRSGSGPSTKHVVHAKLGESWLAFLHRHFEKAGLFIWTTARGDVVISSPNGNQRPTFQWCRLGDGSVARNTKVVDAKLRNDTTRRLGEVHIYTRGTGKKAGFGKLHGDFMDAEMIARRPEGYGLHRLHVERDVNVSTPEQARFYARRKIAEARRAGWSLTYTFAGHTSATPNGHRAVIAPDLVVGVRDEGLGVYENLYIESVEYTSPPQRTVVTMMRVEDLIFGEG